MAAYPPPTHFFRLLAVATEVASNSHASWCMSHWSDSLLLEYLLILPIDRTRASTPPRSLAKSEKIRLYQRLDTTLTRQQPALTPTFISAVAHSTSDELSPVLRISQIWTIRMIEHAVVKKPRTNSTLSATFRLRLICRPKNSGTGNRNVTMSHAMVIVAVAIHVEKSARHSPSMSGRHDFDTGLHWKIITKVDAPCDTIMKTSKATVSF